jgi:hypothetical protein
MTPQTRDKWLLIIRQFEQSSLSLKQFSRSEGLKYATFRNYYYKLRSLISPPQEEAVQNFLPVLVSGAQSAHSDASVVFTLPAGVTLQLERLPPPQYLAQLVACLGSA